MIDLLDLLAVPSAFAFLWCFLEPFDLVDITSSELSNARLSAECRLLDAFVNSVSLLVFWLDESVKI